MVLLLREVLGDSDLWCTKAPQGSLYNGLRTIGGVKVRGRNFFFFLSLSFNEDEFIALREINFGQVLP